MRRPGFHLTMDTLPSGVLLIGGFRSALICFQLSLSCPFRLLHTFPSLRPERHYPRFWIRRSSSERRRDFNPQEQRAAQHTLPVRPTPHRSADGTYSSSLSPAPPAYCCRIPVRSPGSRAWNFPTCLGSLTAQGSRVARVGRHSCCGLPLHETASAPRTRLISQLNTLPACAPVNASPATLRRPAHDSGSGWFAIPFL